MKYRLKELASLCGGELLGTDATVMRVSTDSRTLSEPDGTLFGSYAVGEIVSACKLDI